MAERPTIAGVVPAPPENERRAFLVRATAAVIGAVVGIVPLAAGLVTFFNPLRLGGNGSRWFRVGTVSSLEPGVPERVTIVGDRRDAWTDYRNQPIGAIYLVAEGTGGQIKAFNATCPHAGCSVDFQAAKNCFLCPCHTSAFNLEGKAISDVPPRDMDALECQVRGEGEIWVKYEDFLTGTAERIPKA